MPVVLSACLSRCFSACLAVCLSAERCTDAGVYSSFSPAACLSAKLSGGTARRLSSCFFLNVILFPTGVSLVLIKSVTCYLTQLEESLPVIHP